MRKDIRTEKDERIWEQGAVLSGCITGSGRGEWGGITHGQGVWLRGF